MEQARKCAKRLGKLETQLADVQARLPSFVREVGKIREDLLSAVGPSSESEEKT